MGPRVRLRRCMLPVKTPHPWQRQAAAVQARHRHTHATRRDLRDARCHVEHDDRALPLNVVTITKPAELLLPRRIPHVEGERSTVCVERQRVHLHTESRWKLSGREGEVRKRRGGWGWGEWGAGGSEVM